MTQLKKHLLLLISATSFSLSAMNLDPEETVSDYVLTQHPDFPDTVPHSPCMVSWWVNPKTATEVPLYSYDQQGNPPEKLFEEMATLKKPRGLSDKLKQSYNVIKKVEIQKSSLIESNEIAYHVLKHQINSLTALSDRDFKRLQAFLAVELYHRNIKSAGKAFGKNFKTVQPFKIKIEERRIPLSASRNLLADRNYK